MGLTTRSKVIIGVCVALVLTIVIIIAVYFGVTGAQAKQTTTVAPTTTASIAPTQPAGLRVDCLIDQLVKTRAECEKRNCAWDDGNGVDDSDKCSVTMNQNTGYMLKAKHEVDSKHTEYELSFQGSPSKLFSDSSAVINNVIVKVASTDLYRVTFTDKDNQNRYQVPIQLNLNDQGSMSDLDISYSAIAEKFSIKITRKSTGAIIFNTALADLVMENQYLSLSTRAPTTNVYGLGENLHRNFKHQFKTAETWAMFARDQPPGQDPNQHFDNLYGVHPFYICIEDDGKAHGIFLLNSNAQDVTLTQDRMITYRTIGGILDFFIFPGPTPENVVQQYTKLIGRPYLPPYWALGFQLCRYGYKNTSEVRRAVEETRGAGIPLDVQYADIDYMDGRKDFTIDPEHFADLPAYFHELRDQHQMKTIIILDPAISIEKGYPIYTEGKAANIFIKWPDDGSSAICDQCRDDDHNMFGYVWPDNKTAFPDFFKNSTKLKWAEWIVNQRSTLKFDGLWIDMNEPASFDTNKDKPWNWDTQRPGETPWNLKCDMTNPLENPPYKTKACHIYPGELRNISDKTICMVGLQGNSNEYKHYDVHNLYGWSQTEPTLLALRQAVGQNKRGMVISRSTFAGSGRYAGHWLGDNSADWQHLRDSIIGMLEFNLFGIPYVGADICGFFGDTNPQLCKRWMQLGAFYPFSRNHNGYGYVDHHPGSFDDPTVIALSKSSLEIRYSLLPYLYTLFYHANKDGSTVVRSLQFEWPTDKTCLNISEQFLWGSSVMFSPILYENQTAVTTYLPAGVWYDYHTHSPANGTQKVNIPVNGTSEIPIHLRGGSVIPSKPLQPINTTTQSRLTPFKLLVALEAGAANGELFWDDGESIDTSTTHCYVTFTAENKYLNSTVVDGGCTADGNNEKSLAIEYIDILGVNGAVGQVVIDGQPTTNYTMKPNTLSVGPLFDCQISRAFSLNWN